ncbi:hypothetical protein BDN67DRAFT_985989 [Paxillus ammoniavirescens]|nr:hypothetical protein BDN67DRAFT_985989 [Paxillus ammoniavirescens]
MITIFPRAQRVATNALVRNVLPRPGRPSMKQAYGRQSMIALNIVLKMLEVRCGAGAVRYDDEIQSTVAAQGSLQEQFVRTESAVEQGFTLSHVVMPFSGERKDQPVPRNLLVLIVLLLCRDIRHIAQSILHNEVRNFIDGNGSIGGISVALHGEKCNIRTFVEIFVEIAENFGHVHNIKVKMAIGEVNEGGTIRHHPCIFCFSPTPVHSPMVIHRGVRLNGVWEAVDAFAILITVTASPDCFKGAQQRQCCQDLEREAQDEPDNKM